MFCLFVCTSQISLISVNISVYLNEYVSYDICDHLYDRHILVDIMACIITKPFILNRESVQATEKLHSM
jgi:hypothetical protein